MTNEALAGWTLARAPAPCAACGCVMATTYSCPCGCVAPAPRCSNCNRWAEPRRCDRTDDHDHRGDTWETRR